MAKQALRTKERAPPSRGVAPVDPELRDILGDPSLYPGENVESYYRLYERLRADVAPEDTLEEILLKDFVDQTWESLRLHRLKAKFLKPKIRAKIYKLLRALQYEEEQIANLLFRENNGDVHATKEIDKLLESHLQDRSATAAQVVFENSMELASFDQMISQSNYRRDQVLERIEQHRNGFAKRLRESVVDIETNDYRDVTHGAK